MNATINLHTACTKDDLLTTEFIPEIIGGFACFTTVRKLLALPPKMGGRGILIFNEISNLEYEN